MRRRTFLGATSASLVGLAGCIGGQAEYTIGEVSVPEQSGPVIVDVTVEDASVTIDGPGRITVTLRNESDQRASVRNAGVWPFGLLALTPSDDSDATKTLLVSDQYFETNRVEVTSRLTGLRDDSPIVRSVERNTSVTREYEVHGDRVASSGSGVYAVRGYYTPGIVEYKLPDSDAWTALRPDVTLPLSERGLLSV